MNLIYNFLLVIIPALVVGNGIPRKLRQYKVCNAERCRSIRSLSSELNEDSILFTGWSKWSPCNRKCSTNRYRVCRIQIICGETFVHEEAFCYHRGTRCESIYRNSLQQLSSANPDDSDYQYDAYPEPSSPKNQFQDPEDQRSRSVRNQSKRRPASPNYGTNGISLTSRRRISGSPEEVRRSYFDQDSKASFPTSSEAEAESADGNRNTCGVARITDQNRQGISMRILGGREAVKGIWPWQVAILNRLGETFCGGTLIADKWILTAAHCVKRRIQVTLGEHDLHSEEGTEKSYRVETAFIHPNFDPETVDNDIALLLLPEPVLVEAGTACLPAYNQDLPGTGTVCTILGWGKERYDHVFGTTVLHEGKVPLVSNAECRHTYGALEITSNMFCSGYRNGTVDSCAGDSGGPLLCRQDNKWTIFGVTSFGDGCGRIGKFGIYAKVPNYVRWIHKVIKAAENTHLYF